MAHTQQAAEAAQMEKLQRQMLNIQDTMIEHASLRRKLEDMMDAKAIRTERTLERVQSRNSLLQEDIDRKFGERGSPSPIEKNRVLEQVMSLRTKEFQKSQAKKANHLQNLVEERQRILDARNRLKERKERYRSLPSPVGKETDKHWGVKYSLYSPLPYSGGPCLYTPIHLMSNWGTSLPVWDKRYFTYFPRRKHNNRSDAKRNAIYVPVPLSQSWFY